EDSCNVKSLKENTNPDGSPICEAGCYKCLLSYYNQPEHDKIDRKNELVLTLLCELANAKVTIEKVSQKKSESLALSPLQVALKEILDSQNFPLPDSWNETINGIQIDALYQDMQVAIILTDTSNNQQLTELENYGYIPIVLPEAQSKWHELLEENRELIVGESE
ncbi:MAG TPA: hypothetical protein EYP35_07450, partial [Desulfobacterales bacterium]|nr:hypothetical protein [Desulfobacterales bacterium]